MPNGIQNAPVETGSSTDTGPAEAAASPVEDTGPVEDPRTAMPDGVPDDVLAALDFDYFAAFNS